MDPLTPDDPVGIGPYRLLGRLGAGGMGVVYLARSQGGRTVAVKLVRREFAAEADFRRRFAQEVAAAQRVGGTWTAPVLDADTEGDVPWVATGYVPGPPLDDVVREHGPLPEFSVRVLAHRLARALSAVHGAGLVHRDLKPSNVLLTVDGPRVIDFGIARAMDSVADAVRTRTGVVVGSPGFMSPEQVRGEQITAASDVFSLGAVLTFAATGRLPFGDAAAGMHSLMYRIVQDEPDLSGLPASVADVVGDCLRKDADARPTPEQVAQRTEPSDDADQPWLPGALLADLGRRAAQLLDTDGTPRTPPPPDPGFPAPGSPAPVAPSPGHPPQDGRTQPYPSGTGTPPPPPGSPPVQPATHVQPPPPQPTHLQPTQLGPPTGPQPGPYTGPQEPAPRRTSKRGARIALIAAGVVVLTLLGVPLALYLDGAEKDDGGEAGKGGTHGGGASPTRSGDVADDFGGAWEGEVSGSSQNGLLAIRVVVNEHDRDQDGGVRLLLDAKEQLCEATASERSRTPERLVIDGVDVTRTHPTVASDAPCLPPGRQTLTPTDNGLHWTSGQLSANLKRAATGDKVVSPDALGRWETGTKDGSQATTVTITQGPVGSAVVRTAGTDGDKQCEWTETLFAARDRILVVGPYELDTSKSDDGCRTGGGTHTYVVNGDTLRVQDPHRPPRTVGLLKRAD